MVTIVKHRSFDLFAFAGSKTSDGNIHTEYCASEHSRPNQSF